MSDDAEWTVRVMIDAEPILVTDEMIEVGARAGFELYYGSEPDTDAIWREDKREWVERATAIFRAMRAREPARDGDFQAMLKGYREQYALAVERAGEIAELKSVAADLGRAVTGELGPALLKCQRERDDAVARTFILRDACDRNEQTIAAKDARIAELDTELAAFRGQDVETTPDTEKPSPFRDFRTDPRRMGPL